MASRSATAGNFVLELDGQHCAYIKSIQGGDYEGDIATNDHGPLNMQTKHLANYKYSDFKCKMGIAQSSKMYKWIQDSFRKQYATKSGAVVVGDFNLKATRRKDFMNALITEVTVPACDGSSKEPGYMDISWSAEDVRHSSGGGDLKAEYGVKHKAWLPSMFRFEVSGLEDACKRVSKVDSFTWKQSVVADQIGALRVFTKHAAKITCPDIKLTISAADMDPWKKWAEDWFINGKCLSADHKTGALTFLSPDTSKDVGRIEFKQLGLKKFSEGELTANKEEIDRFTVELYCEEMDFIMNETDA